MADLYVTIDEYQSKIEGTARVKISGGNGADDKHWFPILTAETIIIHPISMDAGAQSDSDAVQVSLQPYKVTRTSDLTSGLLLSLAFQPGDDGFTVHIVQVRPSKTPEAGSEVIHQIDLEHARLSTFQTLMSDGEKASETMTMTYDKFTAQSWASQVGATDAATQGPVAYNVDTSEVQSYVKP